MTLTTLLTVGAVLGAFCLGWYVRHALTRMMADDERASLKTQLTVWQNRATTAEALNRKRSQPHPLGHKCERWESLEALIGERK